MRDSKSRPFVLVQFRAAGVLFGPSIVSDTSPKIEPENKSVPHGATTAPEKEDSATSFAQVARMVAPCAGGLKPGDEIGPNPQAEKLEKAKTAAKKEITSRRPRPAPKPDRKSRHAPKEETKKEGNKPTPRTRPHPLGVRFSATELEIVRAKARAAGCSVNSYIRAAALASDYTPPRDPELTEFMRLYYREYRMQGNNANQIARYCNMGAISPAEAMSGFEAYRQETARIMRAVLQKLANGDPEP